MCVRRSDELTPRNRYDRFGEGRGVRREGGFLRTQALAHVLGMGTAVAGYHGSQDSATSVPPIASMRGSPKLLQAPELQLTPA